MSVAEFLASNHLSDGCQAWMRATALGGVTGTLDMTMWELFHRLGSNLSSVFLRENGVLHWNAHPPNSPEGFVTAWRRALDGAGVEVRTGTAVVGLSGTIDIETADREKENFDAVFLAVPPRAMARVLAGSPEIAGSFGHPLDAVQTVLQESVYEHYGLSWTFDRDFPKDLPLGGNNVRRGWHPILVQYSQYRQYLRPPAVTSVIASVSLDTDFLHPRLGTRARDHAPDDLARILWEDERLGRSDASRAHLDAPLWAVQCHPDRPARAAPHQVEQRRGLRRHEPERAGALLHGLAGVGDPRGKRRGDRLRSKGGAPPDLVSAAVYK